MTGSELQLYIRPVIAAVLLALMEFAGLPLILDTDLKIRSGIQV